MKLSEQGLEFIARFEGYRRYVYDDGAGYATIGYGRNLGPWSKRNLYRARYPLGVTVKQALRMLRTDAANAERAVNSYVHVHLSQRQFDALCSFTYNCGAGALAHSTLLQDVNAGRRGAIEADFLRWDHVGGDVWPGLERRRQAEANLYLRERYR